MTKAVDEQQKEQFQILSLEHRSKMHNLKGVVQSTG